MTRPRPSAQIARWLVQALVVAVAAVAVGRQGQTPLAGRDVLAPKASDVLAHARLAFVPNVGQLPDGVRFTAEGASGQLLVVDDGWVLTTHPRPRAKTEPEERMRERNPLPSPSSPSHQPAGAAAQLKEPEAGAPRNSAPPTGRDTRAVVEPERGLKTRESRGLLPATTEQAAPAAASVRMRFVGANPQTGTHGEKKQPGLAHYYLGNDPSRWYEDVPTYARVRQHDVYPGIDVTYYGTVRELEYDLVVAPGADLTRVRLAFEGASRVELLPDGCLRIDTPAGGVVQRVPVVYQDGPAGRQRVGASYVLTKGATPEVTLRVEPFDRSRPLIIDPVIEWETTYGGSDEDHVVALDADGVGGMCVAGSTYSVDLPGAKPRDHGSLFPDADAFVTCFEADGAIRYAVYLGGLAASRKPKACESPTADSSASH